MRVLVTGSQGLIGRAIIKELTKQNVQIVELDIKNSLEEDIRNYSLVKQRVEGVDGVLHLAAISRVVWGQNNPVLCRQVNEEAFDNLMRCCETAQKSPWILFSSSREVYGEQDILPVTEDAALKPMNIYARSKVYGEALMNQAKANNMTANIVRFSNVYGCIYDHHDRVVPAFAKAASMGGEIRVEGGNNIFDFTHIDDVVRSLKNLVKLTADGQDLDPIHITSGVGTSLQRLAELAATHAAKPVSLVEYPSRNFDVSAFTGNPQRAHKILGHTQQISIEEGIAQLINDFAKDTLQSVKG